MGLLDALSDPQNALAIGLLGAASSGKGFGGGLLDAVNYANAVQQHNEDRTLQKRYRDAQIQELQRKSAADARQQALMADFFGIAAPTAPGAKPAASPAVGSLGPAPSVAPTSMPGQGAPSAGGMPSAAAPQQVPAQGAGGRLAKIAADYGLPIEALQADMLFNGGKKIAELVSSAAKPNWMNINNNLVNTNAPGFKGGFQPGYTTSANGVTTMQMPDGRGGIQTVIPPGALEAYRQFQGVGADLKPIKIFNPITGREEYSNEGAVARGAGGGASSPRPASPAGGRPADIPPPYSNGTPEAAAAEQIQYIQEEMRRLPPGHPHLAGMSREIARLQGLVPQGAQTPQSGNYAAGPSAAETAAAEAERIRAIKTAEADVTRDTATQKKEKSAGEMIAATRRARELLQQGPTSSGIGEMADKAASFFGFSTNGAETAAKLDIVAGDLLNNVPRMEGPQSDGDRLEYRTQAGRAADRNLPINIRMAAMDELERLQQKYAKYNGGMQEGGASGGWDAPRGQQTAPQAAQREFSMLPKASDYDGKRMRAPDGTIYRSAGGKWVKE